ncbi:hypothetical protein DAETH_48120 (plasmid) [Deinococcus aetherius]|uniref:Uncharacterized protein n=1 Tax=Deinococcus aetherius TaxID=200252 RepID=A0ABM8ALZ3_9DEIO|nr:hypothetical protein [Deinococcus aetherius]BDP44843.1 hypothetical protein DAETH_48120 [Deinococcus aetherius]
MDALPVYQFIATYLNSHGGKDPNAKKLPQSRVYTPEELMRPWALPDSLTPFRFNQGEARAVLDALPHLRGANWVFQALIHRIMPLDEIERAAAS